ncbi:Nucleic acid-binding, OB-fold [Sesbania bispinosa]|nr:Nucleic acid-binding, OB-fold [Sesbania bispinosa]
MGFVIDGGLCMRNEHRIKSSLTEDFLDFNKKKTVAELAAAKECGIYIVLATIVNIMEDTKWWRVVNVTPCYKVIIKVFDGLCDACFALSDEDLERLIHKSCKELVDEVEDPTCSKPPPIFGALIGRKLLFKVETKCHPPCNFQRVLPVSQVCESPEIIDKFLKGDTVESREKASDIQLVCDGFNFFPLVPLNKGKEVVVDGRDEGPVISGIPVKRPLLPDDPFDFFGDLGTVNRQFDSAGTSSSFNGSPTNTKQTGIDDTDLTLRI